MKEQEGHYSPRRGTAVSRPGAGRTQPGEPQTSSRQELKDAGADLPAEPAALSFGSAMQTAEPVPSDL